MKKTLIATAIVVVIGGASAYGLQTYKPAPVAAPKAVQQVKKPITITNNGKTVDYDGVVGQTALVTLQSLTKVGTKSSSYGDMVISINGLAADEKSEYWGFYVNGKLANEGAGTYKAASGDKIEWRLEKL